MFLLFVLFFYVYCFFSKKNLYDSRGDLAVDAVCFYCLFNFYYICFVFCISQVREVRRVLEPRVEEQLVVSLVLDLIYIDVQVAITESPSSVVTGVNAATCDAAKSSELPSVIGSSTASGAATAGVASTGVDTVPVAEEGDPDDSDLPSIIGGATTTTSAPLVSPVVTRREPRLSVRFVLEVVTTTTMVEVVCIIYIFYKT